MNVKEIIEKYSPEKAAEIIKARLDDPSRRSSEDVSKRKAFFEALKDELGEDIPVEDLANSIGVGDLNFKPSYSTKGLYIQVFDDTNVSVQVYVDKIVDHNYPASIHFYISADTAENGRNLGKTIKNFRFQKISPSKD